MIWIIFIFAIPIACEGFIVRTQYGEIEGAQRISALNKTYYSFQRIPYMKAPVGNLRFRDAEVPDNWTEVLDCTQEGPRFPQIDMTFDPRGEFAGDLDSMHINVFTNNYTPEILYPVMVWIHGGGFRSGSALTEVYGPDYFMEKDIVLVTFNYRLHVFGFLSLDDPELGIPGNAGFKDQVLALKWVQQNIGIFGGDPHNVTIFGQSSGGGCAHFHTVSELSEGLFQRSIIMSGSAFNPMYAAIPRRNWGFRLSRLLGYTGDDTDKDVLAFLELADPQAIFTAVGNLLTFEESQIERLLNAFGPTIEPYDNGNAFMLEHPEELAVNSWGNDIDILIGATSLENGALIPAFTLVPPIFYSMTNFESFVPHNLNFTDEEREEHGNTLKMMYYGMLEPSFTNIDGAVIMSNEFAFWHSVHRVVKQRWDSNGHGKSYVYRFDVDSDNNCFKTLNGVDERYREPIHMDDLCHLFLTSFASVPEIGSVGFNTTEKMVSLFTSFAASGNPEVTEWNPSTGDIPLTGYNIHDVKSTFGELPEVRRMEVWDTFYANGSIKTSLIFSLSIVMILITIFVN